MRLRRCIGWIVCLAMVGSRGQKIDTSFVLIIFCFFAVSVLTVLVFGGNIYKNVTDVSQEGYNERTCLSYVWTKVKNGDVAGEVHTGDFQGLSVLCIDEEYDGVEYRTMIYLYDGWVREMFSEVGLEFLPEEGTPVIEAESLVFEDIDGGIIKAVSGPESMLISPRGQTSGLAPAA